jgi:hypothetical protein
MFQDEILLFMNQLKSIPFVQTYLKDCYIKNSIDDFEQQSFQNADRFIYFLEHAETYFSQSRQAPLSIKPVLLFYGMNQLIKTCLLTCRPQYPENTKLLAHGVSTRKRKKQSYSFLLDEIKIQQYGLFPYFSDHLFQINQLPSDKFTMDSLLKRIPEMNQTYFFQKGKYPQIEIGKYLSHKLSIPISIIDEWHVTEQRFVNKITPFLPPITEIDTTNDYFNITLEKPINPLKSGLVYVNSENQKLYLTTNRHMTYAMPEILIHYLLLYNLSMICRYETEWWGDLLHTYGSVDYSYILDFLQIAEKKLPVLLGWYLLKAKEK